MSQARKPLTEEVLKEAFARIHEAFGSHDTLASFDAVMTPKDRKIKLAEIGAVMGRGAKFAQVLVWAALNVKDLEDDSYGCLKKLAVAYKVGFISFDTYAVMAKAHAKGYAV